jgi:hypothetical protein
MKSWNLERTMILKGRKVGKCEGFRMTAIATIGVALGPLSESLQ